MASDTPSVTHIFTNTYPMPLFPQKQLLNKPLLLILHVVYVMSLLWVPREQKWFPTLLQEFHVEGKHGPDLPMPMK